MNTKHLFLVYNMLQQTNMYIYMYIIHVSLVCKDKTLRQSWDFMSIQWTPGEEKNTIPRQALTIVSFLD